MAKAKSKTLCDRCRNWARTYFTEIKRGKLVRLCPDCWREQEGEY